MVVSRDRDTVFWVKNKVPIASSEATVPVRNVKDYGSEGVSQIRVERA